ncbi:MAG: amidase [Vicinamibacterales bacterium]|nr:amidase [Vicinamibacterales bacterium]
MSDVLDQTIADLGPQVARGSVKAEALVERCLERVAARNPSLNAFITVTADEALAAARQADAEIAAGRHRGALHGMPVSLKDLIDQAGTPTTAGSRVRRDHRADRDATVTTRLRDAGAALIGKTNLHEFAFGTTTEDSGFGLARHPIDPARSPGGSSGGSAIAVRTGMSLASVGTDTGGSIRIPAAACGVVGLKACHGEISADRVVPLSRQLDHVGPLARSVTDAWLMYEAMRGEPRRCGEQLEGVPVRGLRLGLLRAYAFDRIDADVEASVLEAVERLRRAGAEIDEVRLPHAPDIAAIYLHLVLSDAAAYHTPTLDSRPGDYTPNVRLRLEMGRYVMAEDYVRAGLGKRVIRREVEAALDGRHGLLLPTLAIPAPPLGAATVRITQGDEPVRTAMLRLTQIFNLSGHPAISLPCDPTPAGLPVGLQIAGRRDGTLALLRLARTVESVIAHA